MKKVAVLLSGGVDSLVTAQTLKDQGLPLVGIHFLTGYEASGQSMFLEEPSPSDARYTGSKYSATEIATRLSDQLDFPVEIFDCSKEFKKIVVDYFIEAYQRGKTPNPCLVCNPGIKFDVCLTFAEKLGASHIATGHYARVNKDADGIYHLYRGKDRRKEQSYFLAMLSQKALSLAVFPLGEKTKAETLAFAKSRKLQPVLAEESQDICFIKNRNYGEFLLQQPCFRFQKGPIEDIQGNIIGEHQGLHRYTIGQRRGINCPSSESYYVLKIDTESNKLIVGFKHEAFSKACLVEDVHWIHAVPGMPANLETRLRYRHKAVPSELAPIHGGSVRVRFETPQTSVTPGQGAVFYQGDEVLGGGWIK